MKRIDLKKLKTYSINSRKSKVKLEDFARVVEKGSCFKDFFDGLPNILAAKELREVVDAIIEAKKRKRQVIFMLGAHVIKCGLNPLIIDLMKKDVITHIALNGAGIIHDFEIAYIGQTSEDVGEAIKMGRFGMTKETAEFINRAIKEGAKENIGIGKILGGRIKRYNLKFKNHSILYNGFILSIPVTVHVALGTDIIHQHPSCDGASTGKASLLDFHKFIETVSDLKNGVVLNIGSAVILPEVFLKALSVARNLKKYADNFTAVSMDMLQHYRPLQNVVKRPLSKGGRGICLTGHHEIMLPLLYQAIMERL